MDPNACLQRLLRAIREQDHTETIAAAGDLLNWFLAGAAAPKCTGYERDIITTELARLADRADDSKSMASTLEQIADLAARHTQ